MSILGVSRAALPAGQSVNEALGVPAILRAVSLIANTTGALPVEGYRNGALLHARGRRPASSPGPTRSRRPAPSTATPPTTWRPGASRGGGSRGATPTASPVASSWSRPGRSPSASRAATASARRSAGWAARCAREDMRQTIYLPDETGLRGVGPAPAAAAPRSRSRSSPRSGRPTSSPRTAATPASASRPRAPCREDPETGVHEADTLREQWMSKPHNTPRVYDEGIEEIKEFSVNQQGAQMLEARAYEIGDAARMFGIPGALLEYSVPGSCLTYQNVEGEYTKFVRTCLAPNYLEPIEQELTDLLTRSTVARFNVKGILRADIKTRYEVHKIAIETGIYTPEYAGQLEGFVPGDIEFAPVPPAPAGRGPDGAAGRSRAPGSRARSGRTWRRSSRRRTVTVSEPIVEDRGLPVRGHPDPQRHPRPVRQAAWHRTGAASARAARGTIRRHGGGSLGREITPWRQ